MGNPFRGLRPLTSAEERRIDLIAARHSRRLLGARIVFYSELALLAASLIAVNFGYQAGQTIFALATMPGVFGLVAGGLAIRPLRQTIEGLRLDLNGGAAEIYGDDEVIRLPNSGLAIVLFGNEVDSANAYPVAVGAPKNQVETYPPRLEWRPERRKFAMCRRLTRAELAELEALRRRIATRYLAPTIGFFVFSGLAIIVLRSESKISDPLVPISVMLTGLWFVWRLASDLAMSARLSREHAVITDQIKDGRRERAIEVLPSASLVWTVDRTPARWRF
jgi:hypothetical protein